MNSVFSVLFENKLSDLGPILFKVPMTRNLPIIISLIALENHLKSQYHFFGRKFATLFFVEIFNFIAILDMQIIRVTSYGIMTFEKASFNLFFGTQTYCSTSLSQA